MVELLNSKTFIWKEKHDFIINSGGIKIHVEELEKRIRENFDLPFFIGAIKDRELGEKIVMYIESKESIDTQIIKNQLALILEKHHLPKEYFVLSKFKYNQGGKIDRIKTKAMHPLSDIIDCWFLTSVSRRNLRNIEISPKIPSDKTRSSKENYTTNDGMKYYCKRKSNEKEVQPYTIQPFKRRRKKAKRRTNQKG